MLIALLQNSYLVGLSFDFVFCFSLLSRYKPLPRVTVWLLSAVTSIQQKELHISLFTAMHNLSMTTIRHIKGKTPRIFLPWCFAARAAYSVVIILPLILHALADDSFFNWSR